ncbi:Protein MEI2-like 5 [Linum perenne]
MDDFDLSRLPGSLEDLDDNDLFGSGGGMELETDLQETLSFGISKVNLSDAGNGTVAGEHPYGEHPSRTLFVRNINSNVEDSELKALFEQYGDVRTLYTACKHRGFVMISYYDIRAARTAMRALQNKPLRRRKLDIHFSIPKDNPSDKDINQGTLVVFNLDPSVSNEDLRQIFGAYGEVKEIRETPHKRHHKFIEYYDVRAAEAALKQLNRSDIAGKRIKLEPSRPGGARRYTSKMLLAAIDEKHRGTYDFIYLPIDFKNKCNVGYAFINMVSPSHIIPFYEAFNGKKWEKFNSEKVASLAYARIQGKTALVNHFQNSSLMNEDKRCRPILFRSDGQELVDQVEFQLPYFFVVALSPQFSLQSSSRSKFSVHLSFIDHSRPSTLQQFEHSVPSAKWVTLWGFVRKPHRRLLPRRMLTVKGTSGCALLPAPY